LKKQRIADSLHGFFGGGYQKEGDSDVKRESIKDISRGEDLSAGARI